MIPTHCLLDGLPLDRSTSGLNLTASGVYFSAVRRQHAGNYNCEVNNSVGRKSKQGWLTVLGLREGLSFGGGAYI